jgi:hypothetical protein
MSRSDALRSALERCRQRADYCRREFDRFCSGADPATPSRVAGRAAGKGVSAVTPVATIFAERVFPQGWLS